MIVRVLLTLLLACVLPATATADDAPRSQRDLAPLVTAIEALGDERPPEKLDEITEDPITLRALSAKVRATNEKLSLALFDRAIEKEEINRYEKFAGSAYADAVRAEAWGKLDDARKTWRAAAKRDPLTTYIHASRHSIDPERAALLAEIRAQVQALFDAAKAEQPAAIYTTSRGTVHNLVAITGDEALARLQAGEGLSYVAIDELDLTGKTFTTDVSCSRCVIGKLKGWNSSFTGFSFRGFVLGDLHVGKAWTGEVNRSRSLPAATFDELLLDKAVVFGKLEMDSVHVRKAAGFPFLVVDGAADLRNTRFDGDFDMRFGLMREALVLEGAKFGAAAYFGHVQAGGLELTRASSVAAALLFDSTVFTGPVTAARCKFDRGVTFENARFMDRVDIHHCEISARLNISRARFERPVSLAYVEIDDLDALGAEAAESFAVTDSVVRGNARFALDGFTRRLHLSNPHPLHTLYKQYQGDIDADALLTERSQYGVVHVNDLAVRFGGDASFANTYFEKFVGFEGVVFGSPGSDAVANFYNAQLYGEAHFERTKFYAVADFRTISGNELSFNGAHIARSWMLDDANVPGRLSMSEISFADDATFSFRGARLAYFGITMADILRGDDGESRLFYERCAKQGVSDLSDDRMLSARWDDETESERPEAAAMDRAARLCLDFSIAEFVVLRDSFTKRGMTQEADWAYWNLRHSTNLRERTYAPSAMSAAAAVVQWVFFEKAFGWGVRLENLFWSSLFVILVFMMLFRLLCPDVKLDWDDATLSLKELPPYALFVISLHSFLGRARDWKSKSSNKVWKVLYTTEMVIGILLITFFIGAYARIILR